MHKGIYSVQGEICFLSHKHSTALTPLTVAEPELCLHEEQKLFPALIRYAVCSQRATARVP